jgi:hypothetical protein
VSPQDTPESIFLQPRDEVIVRKRRTHDSDDEEEPAEDTLKAYESYISQVGALLSDEDEHCDVTFFAGEVGHRYPAFCILAIIVV